MTEKKRFTISSDNNQNIYDAEEKCYFSSIDAEKLCNLLNALHEENVKLQARNKYLATKIQRERNIHVKEHEKWENEIQKENEEFKKALVELKEIGDYQEGRIKELNDENEQLKEELEQCKAVIDNRWSEYLQKKELQE